MSTAFFARGLEDCSTFDQTLESPEAGGVVMIAYPLAALLNLRFFRQDKAMRFLQNSERELALARNRVKKAIKDHESFLVWLAAEEENRYQAIMEQEMTLDDVDEFKAGLLTIRARGEPLP